MTLTDFLLARIAEDELGASDLGGTTKRALAECEAKRLIILQCEALQAAQLRHGDPEMLSVRHIVRALTLPYADHPDYREEWRP